MSIPIPNYVGKIVEITSNNDEDLNDFIEDFNKKFNPNNNTLFGDRRCCTFFKTKNGTYYKTHLPSQIACEHFEEIN